MAFDNFKIIYFLKVKIVILKIPIFREEEIQKKINPSIKKHNNKIEIQTLEFQLE